MKRSKSNCLQMKKANKANKKFTISNFKNIRFIEDKMKNNKNVKVVEITPRLSSIDISDPDLDFEKRVDLLVEEMKTRIFQLHKEGNSIRFIANQIGISRELVRNVINGKATLRITAMQRIRAQEMQKIKF